jgi:hypothetical protein
MSATRELGFLDAEDRECLVDDAADRLGEDRVDRSSGDRPIEQPDVDAFAHRKRAAPGRRAVLEAYRQAPSAADQVDTIGISGAFETPCSLVPSGRENRKRRSPTAPSRWRSIASGWCSAVDFTGVTVKRATVAVGMEGA